MVSERKRVDVTSFIIFLHIQKTAGMTFQRILRRNLGRSFPRRVAERMFRREGPRTLVEAMKARTMADGFFAGHLCYGAHRYLPHPYVYVCFLREPLSRLISLYNYSRINGSAYYHRQASTMSPDDFFRESGLLEIDNGQVRFLAGDETDVFINRTSFGECNQKLYELAKRNVENDFALVGTTEHFDASLLLLSDRVGLKRLRYLSRNRGQPESRLLPSDSVLEDLRRLNRYDVQLHEDATAALEALTRAGAGFVDRLDRFRRRNRAFERAALPLYNVYDRWKARIQGQTERPI